MHTAYVHTHLRVRNSALLSKGGNEGGREGGREGERESKREKERKKKGRVCMKEGVFN